MSAVNPAREQSDTARTRPTPAKSVYQSPSAQPQRVPAVRSKSDTRNHLSMLLSLAICAGVAIFLVSRYANLMVANYDLQNMRGTLADLQSKNASLETTVYQLSSPTRILNIAEHVLKMVPASPVQVGSSGK